MVVNQLRKIAWTTQSICWFQTSRQELIRRWDSERELFNDDIAHVLQNTTKDNLFLLTK